LQLRHSLRWNAHVCHLSRDLTSRVTALKIHNRWVLVGEVHLETSILVAHCFLLVLHVQIAHASFAKLLFSTLSFTTHHELILGIHPLVIHEPWRKSRATFLLAWVSLRRLIEECHVLIIRAGT
jgi:hypothetical protein